MPAFKLSELGSAWIYNVIGSADKTFADFLHNEGFREGNKKFKLFNFSPLDFGKPKIWKEKDLFEIFRDQITLKLSFLLNDVAEAFIIGLFKYKEVLLEWNRKMNLTAIEEDQDILLADRSNEQGIGPGIAVHTVREVGTCENTSVVIRGDVDASAVLGRALAHGAHPLEIARAIELQHEEVVGPCAADLRAGIRVEIRVAVRIRPREQDVR